MDSPTLLDRKFLPTTNAKPGKAESTKTGNLATVLAGEWPLIAALIAVGLVAHSLNMFHYPALNRVDDEGIYLAQAWAVLREGHLAPYTYFYDHAPFGWMMLAGWFGVSGGPFTFGNAADSGRIFAMLLHLGMIPLLYRVARKFGCGLPAAAFATLLFSLSPLAITYQRFMLLDNIMLFWLLLSLDLLLDGWGRLSNVVLSGICFGLALLSKETAVFILPAMLYILWQQRWKHQGRFGLAGWLVPVALVVSLYPLYALLKGELLPAGASLAFFILNIDIPSSHVSLIDALKWQSTRTGGGLFNLNNLFWQLVRGTWLPLDPILVAGGAGATALNLVRGWRNRQALALGLLGFLPLFYLARGGIVFDFYFLFAIPFLCLNLAFGLNLILNWLRFFTACALMLVAIVAISGFYWFSGTLEPLFKDQPDQISRTAVSWIKENLSAQSKMIIRDDMWVDLHEPGLGGPAFPNAHSLWKVGLDPAIRDDIFKNNWQTVDYMVMSPGTEQDMTDNNMTVALDALHHSHLVKRWEADGNYIELRKVDKAGVSESQALAGSATYLSNHFEQNGAYLDLNAATPPPARVIPAVDWLASPEVLNGVVSSQNQANALLRAVWSGDKSEFYRVWQWTRRQLVNQNGLLAQKWQAGKIVDGSTASGPDTDAALALLFAAKRWNDPVLLQTGQRMVQAIWQREIKTVNGAPYITAGDWAGGPVIALNPGYFAPYAYHIFQEVDPAHNWSEVINSGYKVLFEASSATLGFSRSAGLPPEWVGLEQSSGKLVTLPGNTNEEDTTRYTPQAAHTYWRIALDASWSKDGRAQDFLRQAGFLKDEVNRKGAVSAIYQHDGNLLDKNFNLESSAGALAALLTLNPAAAQQLYAGQIVSTLGRVPDTSGSYWGRPDSLSDQEWGWFATALYANSLTDLWHNPHPANLLTTACLTAVAGAC